MLVFFTLFCDIAPLWRRLRKIDNQINLGNLYVIAVFQQIILTGAEPVARRKYSDSGDPRLGRFLIDLGHARVSAAQFDSAEKSLLEAQQILGAAGVGAQWDPEDGLKELVSLYEAWNQADPEKGHDADAAKWRTALEQSHPTSTTQP